MDGGRHSTRSAAAQQPGGTKTGNVRDGVPAQQGPVLPCAASAPPLAAPAASARNSATPPLSGSCALPLTTPPSPQPPPRPQPPTAVGDWLQGPYVYALYEKYGYSPAQIGQLFIAGFGSSLVVGTFVGALADRL